MTTSDQHEYPDDVPITPTSRVNSTKANKGHDLSVVTNARPDKTYRPNDPYFSDDREEISDDREETENTNDASARLRAERFVAAKRKRRDALDRPQVDASTKPETTTAFDPNTHDSTPRVVGAEAWSVAAAIAFAPVSVVLLVMTGAPIWATAPPVAGALPLAAAAGASLVRPTSLRIFAWAHIPLLATAFWLMWSSGGLLSPMAPWIFTILASAALSGGGAVGLVAAIGAIMLGALTMLAPEPPISLIGYAPRAERELALLISWSAAGFTFCLAVWGAGKAWAAALPPLRHPTIVARRALSRLVDDAGVAAMRLSEKGLVNQVVGAPETAFDMPARELLGVSALELTHPDDRAALASLLGVNERELGRDDDRRERVVYLRVRSRFGGYRWVDAACVSARGYPVRPGADQKGAEQLLILRARRRPVSETHDIDASERAGILAQIHDGLRQELKAVVGYTDIIRNEIFGPLGAARYREYARLAYDGGAHLLELVDELLELAAVDAGRIGSDEALIDPAPVVDGAVRLANKKAAKLGIAVRFDLPPSTPHIRTDRRALRRILHNLLLDSARRGRVGDRLLLQTEVEEAAIAFRIIATRDDVSSGALKDAIEDAAEIRDEDESVVKEELVIPPEERDLDLGEEGDVTELGEAKLGRLVALSLVDRLNGGVLFTDGEHNFDPLPDIEAGEEHLVVEAIFPIAGAVDSLSAAKASRRVSLFGKAEAAQTLLVAAPTKPSEPSEGRESDRSAAMTDLTAIADEPKT